jgi:hypothetical protein
VALRMDRSYESAGIHEIQSEMKGVNGGDGKFRVGGSSSGCCLEE